jgi:hypothetical protein
MTPKIRKIIVYFSMSLMALFMIISLVYQYDFQNRIRNFLLTNFEAKIQYRTIGLNIYTHFPEARLTIQDLRIDYQDFRLFEADRITADLDLRGLINQEFNLRKVKIEGAKYRHEVDSSGNPALQIRARNRINTVNLLDAAIEIEDSYLFITNLYKQNYFRLNLKEGQFRLNFNGEILNLTGTAAGILDTLSARGKIVLANKKVSTKNAGFSMNMKNKRQSVNGPLQIDQAQFIIKGDFLRISEGSLVDLNITTTDTGTDELLFLAPAKFAARYQQMNPEAKINLHYQTKGLVNPKKRPTQFIRFKVEDVNIMNVNTKLQLDSLNFSGSYTNGLSRGPETAKLRIDRMGFRLGNSFMHGSGRISNFKEPFMEGRLKSSLQLEDLQQFLEIDQFEHIEGEISADLKLSGFLGGENAESILDTTDYQGYLQLQDVSVSFKNLPLQFKHLTGTIKLNQQDLRIERLQGIFKEHPFNLNGMLANYPDLWFNTSEQLAGELSLRFDRFRLRKNDFQDFEKSSGGYPLKKLAGLSVNLEVNHAYYDIDTLLNFRSEVIFEPEGFSLKNIYFNFEGGAIEANSKLVSNSNGLKINVEVNADFPDFNGNRLYNRLSNSRDNKGSNRFRIPGSIEARVNLSSRNLIFRENKFQNLKSRLKIRRGEIHLDHFQLEGLNGIVVASGKVIPVGFRNWKAIGQGRADFISIEAESFAKTIRDLLNENEKQESPEFDFRPYLDLQFTMNASQLKYRDFTASMIHAQVDLTPEAILFNEISFQLPDGSFEGKASIRKDSTARYNGYSLFSSANLKYDELHLESYLRKIKNTHLLESNGSAFELPPYLNLDFGLQIDRLLFKNARGSDLEMKVRITPEAIYLDQAEVSAFHGKNKASAVLKTMPEGGFRGQLYSSNQGISIHDFFYSFQDFDQNLLTHQNIEGSADINMLLHFQVNKHFKLKKDKLDGKLSFTFENGSLQDFKPIENSLSFIRMKNKDDIFIGNITFDAYLNQGKLFIPELILKNSIANVILNGSRTFSNEINLNLMISLSDLLFKSRKKKIEEFKDAEANKKGGMDFYLELNGMDDDLKVKLFNRKKFEINQMSLSEESLLTLQKISKDSIWFHHLPPAPIVYH